MNRLIGAIRFLTILPLRWEGAAPGKSAVFFPLVGAVLGWVGAQWYGFLSAWLGAPLAALLVIATWTWITGGLHEDGLADVADAFGQRTQDRMIAVLKDSRIGAFGAAVLIMVILIRWQALVRMPALPVTELVAAMTMSRAAMVAMAWVSRPVGEGLGAQFAASLTTLSALLVIAQGIAAAFLMNTRAAIMLLAVSWLVFFALNRWFDARLGGVNGDCLGATSLITETALLVMLSCRNCFW
jgi:adenosylcobinamide-GDP ribazoletransferase